MLRPPFSMETVRFTDDNVIYLPRPRPDLKVVTYLCRTPGTNLVTSKVSNGLTDAQSVPLAV